MSSDGELDLMFDALSNRHRRRLLVALLEHNPRAGLSVPADVPTGARDLKTDRAEMFHVHLPKLAEAGFVGWNPDTNEVVKGPRFDELRPVLELLHYHSDELPTDWP